MIRRMRTGIAAQKGVRSRMHQKKKWLDSFIACAIVLSLSSASLLGNARVASQASEWSGVSVSQNVNQLERNPMLHREGTKIVDGKGKTVALKGVNLGGWLLWEAFEWGTSYLTMAGETPMMTRLVELVGRSKAIQFRTDLYKRFIQEEDIKAIRDCGFNVVRVPINHLCLGARSGWFWDKSIYTTEGWGLLDALLGWCEKYGVYAILDLHAAPAAQAPFWVPDYQLFEPLLWDSPSGQEKTIDLWKKIAARYKDREIVAGYELLNELNTFWKHDVLIDFYRRAIAAIREIDPHHLILLEGDNASKDFSMFKCSLDENQAWAPHFYFMSIQDQRSLIDSLKAMDAPVVVTEFGGTTDYKMVEDQVALFEETGVSWVFWTWKATTETPEWDVCQIHHTPTWDKVINWLAGEWFAPKPSFREAVTGMAEFLVSMVYANCTINEPMLEILSPLE